MEQVTFVQSKRGGHLLNLNAYLLSINNKLVDKSYWRCRVQGCRVTAVTRENHLLSTNTHPTNVGAVNEKIAVARAKLDAMQQPSKPMKRVFADAFHNDAVQLQNNYLKSWHATLTKTMNPPHPNVLPSSKQYKGNSSASNTKLEQLHCHFSARSTQRWQIGWSDSDNASSMER